MQCPKCSGAGGKRWISLSGPKYNLRQDENWQLCSKCKGEGIITFPTYIYRGDKLTAPHLKGQPCTAVRRPNGKCIKGSNSNMLVEFETAGRHVVLARQLRKITKPNNEYQ